MVQSCHGVDNERERERDFGDSNDGEADDYWGIWLWNFGMIDRGIHASCEGSKIETNFPHDSIA